MLSIQATSVPFRVLRALGTSLLAVLLLAWGGPEALGQQAGGGGAAPHVQREAPAVQGRSQGIPSALKKRLSEEMVRRLRQARRQGGTEVGPRPKAIGGFPEVGPSQSWVRNQNPYSQLNFRVLGTPQYAGDVNGDGTNDYLYTTASARDERTSGSWKT